MFVERQLGCSRDLRIGTDWTSYEEVGWSENFDSVLRMAGSSNQRPAVEASLYLGSDGRQLLEVQELRANYPFDVGLGRFDGCLPKSTKVGCPFRCSMPVYSIGKEVGGDSCLGWCLLQELVECLKVRSCSLKVASIVGVDVGWASLSRNKALQAFVGGSIRDHLQMDSLDAEANEHT